MRLRERVTGARSLSSLLDQNPLVWMAEVNGMLADLHDMPREVQEIAFARRDDDPDRHDRERRAQGEPLLKS